MTAVPSPQLAEVLRRFERESQRGVLDTGHYRCPYFVWGDGPSLLLIHGLADSSQTFVFLAFLLQAHFRCIAYDLPNGVSDGADFARCTLDVLAQDGIDLMHHLGERRWAVLGSSFGTAIALRTLVRHPESISAAILQAPVAHKPLRPIERIATWFMSYSTRALGGNRLYRRVVEKLHREPFLGRAESEWEHFLRYTSALPVKPVGRLARLLHRVDLRANLGQIQQPILLIGGDRDPIIPLTSLDKLAQQLPRAQTLVLRGSGHLPGLSHAREMATSIVEFLRGVRALADGAGH